MISIEAHHLDSNKIQWIAKEVGATSYDIIHIVFNIPNVFNQREALLLILDTIKRNSIIWLKSINYEEWIIDLDSLKSSFDILKSIDWLKGKLHIKPEFTPSISVGRTFTLAKVKFIISSFDSNQTHDDSQSAKVLRPAPQEQAMETETTEKRDGSMVEAHGQSLIGNNIFIGHGRSNAWRELKDFLSERLKLNYDEYNREATAGYSRKERLLQMLAGARFAFLVLTAEDEHADREKHARESVIHEVGLFQGKLGFERAIILLEEGCNEFSNIEGLDQIRFPVGDISAKFEEIRRVLEREGIVEKIRDQGQI